MGVLDNLSEELKEYTSIYSDILVGLHNDVGTYKKEVDIQKKATYTALSKTENILNSNKNTLDYIQEIQNQITSWYSDFNDEKSELIEELKVKEEFFKKLSKTIETKQDLILKTTKENNNYFNDNLILLQNIKNNFNNQIKIVNLLDLELKTLKNKFYQETEKTNKKLTSLEERLQSISEVVHNQLSEQDERLQIIEKRMKVHHVILYTICIILILVIIILLLYKI